MMENPITVTMIVAYMVGVTAIGSMLARRSRGSQEWAVAGGSMGMLMIAVGIAGTRIGGVGTYGVAADIVRDGLWNMWYGVNTFLAMALTGIFFAVAYRRLRLQTVGEIFTQRFGHPRNQVFTSLCVQTEYLIVNIIEPFVIGKILTGVTGWPFTLTVFIGAAVIITYTALGGLWGSAATNLIHCIVILAGLLLVGLVGLDKLGGWEAMGNKIDVALAEAGKDRDRWWSFTGLGWGAVIGMFFSATIHTPAASVYVNYSTAAKNEKIIIPAFLLGGLIASAMPILAGWIGMQTLATYGSNAQLTSYLSITKLAADVNPVIGGIALAAILAAVISSGGPILLASSTMFVRDWLRFTRDWDSDRKLRAYRITSIVYGLIAAIIAWRIDKTDVSLLSLLLLGFAMVVPPAIAVGYLIYWKRTTEGGAFWGMVAGYIAGLIWYGLILHAERIGLSVEGSSGLARKIFHWCFVHNGEGLDPSYVTTLVPLVLVPLLSVLTPEELERKSFFYRRLRDASSLVNYSGKQIRLTQERLDHILLHPEMKSMTEELISVLKSPEMIIESVSDATVHLYYKFMARTLVGSKYLCVVVKETTEEPFVMTGYLTARPKRGRILWSKK